LAREPALDFIVHMKLAGFSNSFRAPLCLGAILICGALSSANAITLVGWNFSDESATPDTVATGISVTGNALGYNGTVPAPTSRFDGSESSGSYTYPSGTAAAAITTGVNNAYYEFTLSGAASFDVLGFQLGTARLATGRLVDFQLLHVEDGGATLTPLSMDVYSSIENNYSNPTGTATLTGVTSFTIGNNTADIDGTSAGVGVIFATAIADLSGVSASSSNTFRVSYDRTQNNAGALFNELRIEGAAIPEPATVALLLGGLSVLGLCVLRKGKKSRL